MSPYHHPNVSIECYTVFTCRMTGFTSLPLFHKCSFLQVTRRWKPCMTIMTKNEPLPWNCSIEQASSLQIPNATFLPFQPHRAQEQGRHTRFMRPAICQSQKESGGHRFRFRMLGS